ALIFASPPLASVLRAMRSSAVGSAGAAVRARTPTGFVQHAMATATTANVRIILHLARETKWMQIVPRTPSVAGELTLLGKWSAEAELVIRCAAVDQRIEVPRAMPAAQRAGQIPTHLLLSPTLPNRSRVSGPAAFAA